jgi:hypothetical protein
MYEIRRFTESQPTKHVKFNNIRTMKSLILLAAGVLALSTAGRATAQTKIYITGSTAFRSATTTAIDAVLAGTVTKASDNATFTSANAVTWEGGNIGGTAVTIRASWSVRRRSSNGRGVAAGAVPPGWRHGHAPIQIRGTRPTRRKARRRISP